MPSVAGTLPYKSARFPGGVLSVYAGEDLFQVVGKLEVMQVLFDEWVLSTEHQHFSPYHLASVPRGFT